MKRNDRCSNPKAPSDCHAPQIVLKVQPFPEIGVLAENSNLPLRLLAGRIHKIQDRAYSYVVSTVKMKSEMLGFEQHGSAPNFQGDVLTLCTCKHQMRSRLSADDWENNLWIAGFTSRTLYDRKHWLFYLARVESAHDSHSDLWSTLDAAIRNTKAAHAHYLGDLFKPQTPRPTGDARFSPSRYVMPSVHVHRQKKNDTGWHNDINYYLASKSRHPPLLVADPKRTFLWNEPVIYFSPKKHCRDYFKWSSLQDLIAQLRGGR